MPSALSPASVFNVPRAPLVGRATDIEKVTRWLEEDARVVTITGPSGIGKTRVALEIARTCDVRSAAIFVELGDAHDEASLCDAMGRALDLAEENGAADEVMRIGRALANKGDVLLVLDGFEGVATIADATLSRWLVTAPEIAFIVVSQTRTRISGEVVHELPPLPEAEALFVSCAQRIRAGWEPADAEREAVTAIVSELEGVPLAIELAATRLSVMGVRALLHRIRSGAPGIRDGLLRALEGTWSSLVEDEQRAIAYCTVFCGGFTIDAAEALLVTERAAIDVVTSLRDKSLLFARETEGGDVRLDMTRSLRAYAAKKLDETLGARADAEARHAAYFVSFAAQNADARDADARVRLLADRENLLAVIERVARKGPVSARVAEPALRALLALAPVLFAYGPLRAYEVLVDPAIAATRGSGADPSLVAQVLLVRGALHRHRGAAAKGARDLVQALGISRSIESAPLEARATIELAHALYDAGDVAAATDHFQRAADLYATAGDLREAGRANASLAALLAKSGNADEARALIKRALLAHDGDLAARTEDFLSLGAIELSEGRIAAARTATEESLSIATAQANGRGAALARMQLGLVAQRAGDRALARTYLEAASRSFAELGFEALAATAEGHLGVVAQEDGKIAEAHARLSAACSALRELSLGAAASLFTERLAGLDAKTSGTAPPPATALVIGEDGAWFRAPNGARVGLENRKPLARITERLAIERVERPGAALTARVLQEAAWAGEKILAAAGAHRVRVAISTLRKLGLPIVTQEDGYALDREPPFVRG